MVVPLVPVAAAGFVESLQDRLSPFVVGVDERLVAAAALLADGLERVPVFVLALAVGLAAWRGRAPVAGVVAALAVHAAAVSEAWPAAMLTVATALLVGLVAWPVGALVAAAHVAVRQRLPATAPPVAVAAPVVVAAALLGLLLGAVAFDQSFLLGAVGSAGLVSGELAALGSASRWPLPGPAVHVLCSYVVVLFAEVLSGDGVGGVLARSIPTAEGRAFLGAFTAATMVLLALAAAASTERRTRHTAHGAPAGGAAREESA